MPEPKNAQAELPIVLPAKTSENTETENAQTKTIENEKKDSGNYTNCGQSFNFFIKFPIFGNITILIQSFFWFSLITEILSDEPLEHIIQKESDQSKPALKDATAKEVPGDIQNPEVELAKAPKKSKKRKPKGQFIG